MSSWGIAVRPRAGRLIRAALMAGAIALIPATAQAATFTVTNTGDTGTGSLRQAILNSNGNPAGGTNTNLIAFAIDPGGAQTISPGSALPAITAPVVIDGASQTGFESAPLIRLDGAAAGSGTAGLTITAGHSAVQNLEITDFKGAGIVLKTGGSDTVSGSYIGTDGASKLGNSTGIQVLSSLNSIGGLSAADRNVISGNSNWGILLSGSGAANNLMIGNYVGTSAGGTAAVGNGQEGVFMLAGATGNSVGNTRAGARNVISGNGNDGVSIAGTGTTHNVVQGNYLGTTVAGTSALPNAVEGAGIFGGATANTIGGTTPAARNVISGNTGDGVGISQKGTSLNLVEGNYVGTDPTGTKAVLNAGIGVAVFTGATKNAVGGTTAGARNVISGNGHFGVALVGTGTSGNLVEGNYVGTRAGGSVALANSSGGVYLYGGSSGNTVGGKTAGARNVISGNGANGVEMSNGGTTGNVVEGNFIGTKAGGGAALPNANDGVAIVLGAAGNTIGGTAAGTGNTIAFSKLDGVQIDGSATHGNRVERNSIFSSLRKVGIALTHHGNGDQAAPVVTRVQQSGSSTKLFLKVPSGKYRVELFANPSCADPEGHRFLGAVSLSGGRWSVKLSSKLPAGQGVTATATNTQTGNTSRFSACRNVP